MGIDRHALIDCLEALESEDDAAALDAARKAAKLVDEAGLEWDEVISKGLRPPKAGPKLDLSDDDESVRKAIDAMLARSDLNESTAEDLRDFRADLEKGELDASDRGYILGLYARLN